MHVSSGASVSTIFEGPFPNPLSFLTLGISGALWLRLSSKTLSEQREGYFVKTFLSSFAIGVAGYLCVGLFNTAGDLEVSASVAVHATADFYDPLAADGAWVEAGSYGRCWRPAHVAAEWRPYCYGHWVWTDCGWYWVSDEPWAWACYHYGSWVYDPSYTWIWVPGIEWGPAWVSWRVGGGYVGWAPLPPPHVRVSVSAPAPFVFVETQRFHEHLRPSTVIVNNTTIINKTTEINNIRRETRTFASAGPQKVVVNEGPGMAPIQKATGKEIRPVPIQEAVRQTPVPPALARRTSEKPSNTREQPKLSQEPKPAPGEIPKPPPSKAIPSEKTRPPSREEIKPSPERPRVPAPPPAPSKPPKEEPKPKPPPREVPEQPPKATPPERPPPRDEVRRAPEQRPVPPRSPAKPSEPLKGKAEGKDKEPKDRF